MNWALLSMVYSMAATVIVGVLMIAALVIGYDEIPHIIGVAIVGLVVSVPISFVFTKKIGSIKGDAENAPHQNYPHKSPPRQ